MGFPVPARRLAEGAGAASSSTTSPPRAHRRGYLQPHADLGRLLESEPGFGRNVWALLSLELWHQSFHDSSHRWDELRRRVTTPAADAADDGLVVVGA